MQTNELQNLIYAIEKTPFLEQRVNALYEKVSRIEAELENHNSSSDWVTLRKAAKSIGTTEAALRQRIKADLYPEGIVWKQRQSKGRIFINLQQLGEYM